jgi:hypothetical protein
VTFYPLFTQIKADLSNQAHSQLVALNITELSFFGVLLRLMYWLTKLFFWEGLPDTQDPTGNTNRIQSPVA